MDDYLILDLNKQRAKFRSNRPTYVRQGELESAPLSVQITRDGKPYDLTGCRVFFEAERGDGHKFVEAAAITSAENGFVSHTLPAGLMVAHGTVQLAYFSVYNGEEIITTETMDITTLPGICMFTDSDYIPYIERIIIELEGYLANAEALTDTVGRLVTQATGMLSNVNKAVNESQAAVSQAESATDEASLAAASARVAAGNVRGFVHEAVSHITGVWLDEKAADDLDTLAENSCTSGMFVNGAWYVHASDVSFSGGVLHVKGGKIKEGRLHLPTRRCQSRSALETAQDGRNKAEAAYRSSAVNAATIERLLSEIAALKSAFTTLATHAGSYPFYIDGTMYVRGVSYNSGILYVPNATYKDGRMHLSSM